MKTPRRLIEEGTPFEREVLASARLDGGSEQGFGRTLRAIDVAATSASVTASAAGTGSGVLASGGGGSLLGSLGAGMTVKWLGLATMLLGGAALSASLVAHLTPVPTAMPGPSESSRSSIQEMPRAETSNVSQPPALPALSPRNEPSLAPTPRRAPPSLPVTTPPRDTPTLSKPPAFDSASTLNAEVVALDQVRTSLSNEDTSTALRQLDAYDRACGACVLDDEATVLRVDALTKQGDAAGAAVLAERFLAAKPLSPHAPHLRRIILGVGQNP